MFEEAFPYYLAMGMTYEQYWEQDSWIVKYYRKAQEIRFEEQNRQAWLQGMYIYEAIADVAPILHPFAKKGTKARKYSEKPYEFKKPEKKSNLSELDREAKAKSEKLKSMMFAQMNKNNAENAKKRIRDAEKKKLEAAKALMEGDETDTTRTDADGAETR